MDSEFALFTRKCQEELCLPSDTRLDDFMEFLEAFTSEIREQATQTVRRELLYDHDNPGMSGPRGPDPDSDEGERRVEEAVRCDLRECGRKLAKLMDGIG